MDVICVIMIMVRRGGFDICAWRERKLLVTIVRHDEDLPRSASNQQQTAVDIGTSAIIS